MTPTPTGNQQWGDYGVHPNILIKYPSGALHGVYPQDRNLVAQSTGNTSYKIYNSAGSRRAFCGMKFVCKYPIKATAVTCAFDTRGMTAANLPTLVAKIWDANGNVVGASSGSFFKKATYNAYPYNHGAQVSFDSPVILAADTVYYVGLTPANDTDGNATDGYWMLSAGTNVNNYFTSPSAGSGVNFGCKSVWCVNADGATTPAWTELDYVFFGIHLIGEIYSAGGSVILIED